MKSLLASILLYASANADTITAYCACNRCCGRWSKTGTTSAGTKPAAGRTAAGPRHIPLGTVVFIAGVGVRTVEDRTARRYDGRWEIYFDTHQSAKAFGKRELKVYVLQQPSKSRKISRSGASL